MKENNNKLSVTKDVEFKILLSIEEIDKIDEKIGNVTNYLKKNIDKSEISKAGEGDSN